MLFTHLITGSLVIVALLATRSNFGSSGVYILFAILGLATSWRQRKSNKPLPYLRIILNIIFVILTIYALLPFFIKKPADILSGLIKVWIYFVILTTFIVQTKRDYYLIQAFSAGLLVFSCFDQSVPGPIVLTFVLTFFIIWIIALRVIDLSKDAKEIKQTFHPKKWLYQEAKIGIVFFLAMILLTMPIYTIIPRFDIPLPYYPLIEQKYSIAYADFLKGLISFFSPVKETASKSLAGESSKISEKALGELLDTEEPIAKPVFWHSPEEYKNREKELEKRSKGTKKEIDNIDQELKSIAQEEQLPQIKESIDERKRLTERKEEVSKNLEEIEEEETRLKKEYLSAVKKKNVTLINDPDNRDLIDSLNEKTQNLEKKLEDIMDPLKNLTEEMDRIDKSMDEVRSTVYRESAKSDKEDRIQELWAKKEFLEAKLEHLKKELRTIQEEYNQYIKLIEENQVAPIEYRSSEEYESILKELNKQVEKAQEEIAEIDKQLEKTSQEKQMPKIEEAIQEREALIEKKEELTKNIEELQKDEARLKEEHLKATLEQKDALINEPQNKDFHYDLPP